MHSSLGYQAASSYILGLRSCSVTHPMLDKHLLCSVFTCLGPICLRLATQDLFDQDSTPLLEIYLLWTHLLEVTYSKVNFSRPICSGLTSSAQESLARDPST
ncbi:hypothetical protein I3842_09G156800 [Carya illinoinensis]|uniref:Uncharacterized protein n=1 Tax=Carya illinoinensis TaxID=32201 RepID=A0A922E4R1_CARIL|nr:hypothetical protein I3842_09G156800 [Carya illinoinensis]